VRPTRSFALAALLIAVVLALLASPAMAGGRHGPTVRFERIQGYAAPGTPAQYNKVGILKTGSPRARNVLVLNPGTSASASYFEPLAKSLTQQLHGWQVWAVERRENQLEDQSVFDQAKQGTATPQRVFDYYLGWLVNSSITDHFKLIPDADVAYAKNWGMNVEIQDLNRVVERAKQLHGKVVVGGHSLGGSITSAYATWDFNGKPGAKGLAGLVFIDGGSSPTPVTPEAATASLQALQAGSPWLSFGGIPAPFAGLFNTAGALSVLTDPDSPSLGQSFPLLPANLKPPIPVTNIGQYGYALDTETSPSTLVAAQAHLGHLDTSTSPAGWDDANELTPIRRYAKGFGGWGLLGLDGTAWYHPQRLTIDSGAVAAGNANPAQQVLDVHATHGHDLSHRLKIYAFGAALGGQRVLDAATILADQSGIPHRNLLLIDRHETYAHNDPNTAAPRKNDFLKNLVPFLAKIGGKGHRRSHY
jgi:pimeloyl-ACP methyl ester carboxylesterase